MTGTGPSPAQAGTPQPTAEMDAQLARVVKGYYRLRWAAIGGTLVLLLVITGFLVARDFAQQSELRSSCQFWALLAPLPVTVTPPAVRPSEITVTLIAVSRDAFEGEGCGHLPPAAPSLLKWATYYRIDVP